MENLDPNEVMGMCSGTKRGAIIRMFEASMTLEEISQPSGGLSGCGGCEWDVSEFLKALQELKANIYNVLNFSLISNHLSYIHMQHQTCCPATARVVPAEYTS